MHVTERTLKQGEEMEVVDLGMREILPQTTCVGHVGLCAWLGNPLGQEPHDSEGAQILTWTSPK